MMSGLQWSLFVSFARTKCSHLNLIKNVSLKSGENTKKNTVIILVLTTKVFFRRTDGQRKYCENTAKNTAKNTRIQRV